MQMLGIQQFNSTVLAYSMGTNMFSPSSPLIIWRFPESWGYPQSSSVLVGCSIKNHPFWGTLILGNLPISSDCHSKQLLPATVLNQSASGRTGLSDSDPPATQIFRRPHLNSRMICHHQPSTWACLQLPISGQRCQQVLHWWLWHWSQMVSEWIFW